MELREPQIGLALEEVVQPLARRVQLQPVARVRRDERPAAAVLLDPELPCLRARKRADELVLVEREAEMVDARQLPLARLDDDVDRTPLELRQAELEAHAVELLPAVAGLEGGDLLADPAVPGDEIEAELPEISCFDLAHLARHEVVVEKVHERQRRRRKADRALHRRPPRRSRRLVDRAQPAVLPGAAGTARLLPGDRSRRRARR